MSATRYLLMGLVTPGAKEDTVEIFQWFTDQAEASRVLGEVWRKSPQLGARVIECGPKSDGDLKPWEDGAVWVHYRDGRGYKRLDEWP